jgi:hypothetical protein
MPTQSVPAQPRRKRKPTPKPEPIPITHKVVYRDPKAPKAADGISADPEDDAKIRECLLRQVRPPGK